MRVFKRLLVLGMCMTLLASPLEVSASSLAGGSAIEDGLEALMEDAGITLEEAKIELEDYYKVLLLSTYDEEALTKV